MDDIVVLLGERFVSRKDVKAWQHRDGSWEPERTTMKMGDFRRHLSGQASMGHYLTGTDDTCKLFAYDLDLDATGLWRPEEEGAEPVGFNPREAWLDPNHPARPQLAHELRCLAEGLASRAHRLTGSHVAIAYSGCKGLHVYVFTGSVPTREAFEAWAFVLESFGCFQPVRGQVFWKHTDLYPNITIERFPKQPTIEGKDLGNLMRLPLGVNLKTGHRSHFVWCGSGSSTTSFDVMDPKAALSGTLPWGDA